MLSQFTQSFELGQVYWGHASGSQAVVASITFIVISILFSLRRLLRPVDKFQAPSGKKWKLPPGPRGLPLIGNLLLYRQGESAARKIARYGEMTTTHLGSKLWVVLNSDRLVAELYARKGSITNGRPDYPMVSDLISQGRRSVLLPIKGWSERRRVMHQLLSGTALAKYQGYQDQESIRLLEGYLDNPRKWYAHHLRYSNTVIHRITFGESPNEIDMSAVTKAQMLFLQNAPPCNFWDCFPELARLPRMFQWWRQKYEEMGQFTNDAYSAYWTPIKRAIEDGKAPQSFARDLILGEGNFNGSQLDKMFLSMQLVEAGSDTTRLGLNIAILAAVVNPDKFLKARVEIDSICGSNAERLPSFEDEERLPYVNAFIKELLRWRRIFVWTPEHTLTDNLQFEGYHFPKGTNFVINHVAIAENSDRYEDPLRFLPERWLDGHETDLTGGSWQFGSGRRLCVGYKLAQRSLFIILSRLIYSFDFEAREPFDDKDIAHFTPNEPFPVSAKVRGERFAQLILRSAQA